MISIPDPRTTRPTVTRPYERLGTVSFPSGRLAVIDVGLLGEAWTDWALVVDGIPPGEHTVLGARVGSGRWSDCWREVWIQFAGGVTAREEPLGSIVVDFARIGFVDVDAIPHWSANESLDGRADFVFWGRDAKALAAAVSAPELEDGTFGWCDRPVDEVIGLGTRAEQVKAEKGWLLATDFRPHTQHYLLLAQARAAATGSGTTTLGDSTMLLFFTSWGDGEYPVVVERDADGKLLKLRVLLQTDATVSGMESVNP